MNNKDKFVSKEIEANTPKMQKRDLAESNFELVLLAAQRCRQLVNGANPRVGASNKKTRNTYIAVKEIELGLIGFDGNYDD